MSKNRSGRIHTTQMPVVTLGRSLELGVWSSRGLGFHYLYYILFLSILCECFIMRLRDASNVCVFFQDAFVETQPPGHQAGPLGGGQVTSVETAQWDARPRRERARVSSAVSTMRRQSETPRRALAGTQPCWHLDLGLAASRIPVVYKPPRLWHYV